jgi:hypothetical protein
MSATSERTREDVAVELAIANAAAKVVRDPLSPRAVEVHAEIDRLLDELVGR